MASPPESGWFVEQGIGEERALLIESDRPVAAAVRWHDELQKGQIEDAVLISRAKGSKRGRVRFANGEEALADRLPLDSSEGATLRFEVTRPAMGERMRVKLAHARPTTLDPRPAPTLAEQLSAQIVPRIRYDLWEEVLDEARDGIHNFTGGSLHFSPTPAMTLVDVDGRLAPRELALAAVEPLAHALRLFGIGGMIGIDFPTLPAKADRKAVDEALDAALSDWHHERTAMNGFGFVQIVARLERPSLLHLLRHRPAEASARLLLRRAEEISEPGAIELTAHPAVFAKLREEWVGELTRRTGRVVRTRPDDTLALNAAFAQAVPL